MTKGIRYIDGYAFCYWCTHPVARGNRTENIASCMQLRKAS